VRVDPASDAELDALERRVDAWLAAERAANPLVDAVDRGEAGERRWYVRVRGDEKPTSTIWLTLSQRTLRFEVYVLPAPEAEPARFYEHLLRRNRQLMGMAFCIGDEDALYLAGHVPTEQVDEATLDWLVGSVWAAVEQCFRPAARIGFPHWDSR